ncbi:replication-relaxation family protein [Kitasatospora sp. NPDC058190]|uniref:replication-relaxation family protein n=1 Tax=Kitasatospora sp. NPDC058190 TaxID=3346371 RepID=UPI0036DE1C98
MPPAVESTQASSVRYPIRRASSAPNSSTPVIPSAYRPAYRPSGARPAAPCCTGVRRHAYRRLAGTARRCLRSDASTARPALPDDHDDQADAVEPQRPSQPGRTAFRRGADNPNGSTTALRADVLGALGVLKVATAEQLQRLLRPGTASNKAIRQALGDLALHGLVASDGNTKDRHKTWRLEGTAGLEAAGQVLGLPRSDMGSTARGAGRSGAQHAMAVNETIAALTYRSGRRSVWRERGVRSRAVRPSRCKFCGRSDCWVWWCSGRWFIRVIRSGGCGLGRPVWL